MKPLVLFLILLLISSAQAFAKGGPQEIRIEGPRLAAPIQVTDPEVLKLFGFEHESVVLMKFADVAAGSIAEPRVGEPYRISLGGANQYYAINYYPNSAGERGYVHDFYVTGTHKWYHASAEGDAVMQRLLKEKGVSLAPTVSPFAVQLNAPGVWAAALFVALAVGAFSLVLWRTRHATM